MAADFSAYQTSFHQQWGMLADPHVRALAWLLDSPDMLDASASRWEGRLASPSAITGSSPREFLIAVDRQPASLHEFLASQPLVRLGRYAEKLLAWYFMRTEVLHAHGLQVRDADEVTLGEFDFLLRFPQGLEHWELATKFYLLRPGAGAERDQQSPGNRPDYFIGPNLADTLGAKMQKIFGRQLSLGQHPSAQSLLGEPLAAAKALIKGWLFYRKEASIDVKTLGVSGRHCRGWWCRVDELDAHLGSASIILPRLSWLAPARAKSEDLRPRTEAMTLIADKLTATDMPLMVANLAQSESGWQETDRGFVVPADWEARAIA